MTYIELKNISKNYNNKKVLNNVSLNINKGEIIIINGLSGSGKTTLLNILAGLTKPTNGYLIIDNINIFNLKQRKLTKFRRNNIGYLYQHNNLIEYLTVKENIELICKSCKNSMDSNYVIKKFSLTKIKDNYPTMLCEKEKQLVVLAGLIAKKPKIILLDEPIKLFEDYKNSKILKTFKSIINKEHITVVITTHNNFLLDIADKIINIKKGKITYLTSNKNKGTI